MISRLLTLILSLFTLFACSDVPEENGPKRVTTAYLKSLCRGDHYRIVEDLSIRGVVVATDWLGELNKSLIVVDPTGGIEVAIDCKEIAGRVPIFSEVEILCSGLALARIGSKIELGAMPTGDFPLDNIDDVMFDRYIRVVGVCSDFEASTKRFSEVGSDDISNIFRFEGIRICDEERGLKWCDTDENNEPITTYRTFVDSEGYTLAVRTLATCDYATESIPTNEITVIGAIDYSDNRYFLKVVNKTIIE